MDIVKIKGFDMSYSTSGTWTRKEIKTDIGLINIDMVGWLVEDREDCVIIALEYQPDDDQFRHLVAIPKVCIQELKKLRKS